VIAKAFGYDSATMRSITRDGTPASCERDESFRVQRKGIGALDEPRLDDRDVDGPRCLDDVVGRERRARGSARLNDCRDA